MTWPALWATRGFTSTALLPASWAYRLGLALRPDPSPTRVDGLQVVSVGNVLVGGAGKTPVALWLAERALCHGHRVALLSRGYGRRTKGPVAWRRTETETAPSADAVGDEPAMVARRLPDILLFVDADRVAAAQQAKRAGCTVAILDDGFQHRRLHRDLDVLVDAGLGNGRLLPAGPLREPPTAALRAHVIWARDGASALHAPQALRVDAATSWSHLIRPDGSVAPLAELTSGPWVAFAGLARPGQFFDMLAAHHAPVLARRAFGDHHAFSTRDLHALLALAQRHQARLLTTEKDRARLPTDFSAWSLRLRLEVPEAAQRALAALLGWRYSPDAASNAHP